MSETRRSNPSESQSLRCIALFGGGRWSRVLLQVLKSMIPIDCKIVWFTQHGYHAAQRWLHESGLQLVEVGTPVHTSNGVDLSKIDLTRFNAAVVATSPWTHTGCLQELIRQRVPTFCEKPLALRTCEATRVAELAQSSNCPLGVDLVLHFADYLSQFSESIRQVLAERSITEVQIEWLDPWTEERYGETKHGDFYTSIVHDIWPHCWSVLRRIDTSLTAVEVIDVTYDPQFGVHIFLSTTQAFVGVRLTRRNAERIRRVTINKGEALLDFSTEPGWSLINGRKIHYQWSGARPLSRSLQSFFDTITDSRSKDSWPLSAIHCLDSVRSAEAIAARLEEVLMGQIAALATNGVALADERCRNLIVDAILPRVAEQGTRWPVVTEAQQVEFVKWFCAENQIRCY